MSTTAINLLTSAFDEGDINQGSLTAFTNIHDIGNTIQQGLGMNVSDLQASEVVLVTLLVDDSGSISSAGNEQPMRDGVNQCLQALIDSKQQDNILVRIVYLNGTQLVPYTPLTNIPLLDAHNYRANGGTPLYDESVTTLATVIAKTKDFENNGVQVRTITAICTDGADCGSRNSNKHDVYTVVKDMFTAEKHIVAGIGFSDGSTDFNRVFNEMGVPSQWILTAGSTPTEIRKAFNVFSRSATSASKSAANFAQTSMGGFGNP